MRYRYSTVYSTLVGQKDKRQGSTPFEEARGLNETRSSSSSSSFAGTICVSAHAFRRTCATRNPPVEYYSLPRPTLAVRHAEASRVRDKILPFAAYPHICRGGNRRISVPSGRFSGEFVSQRPRRQSTNRRFGSNRTRTRRREEVQSSFTAQLTHGDNSVHFTRKKKFGRIKQKSGGIDQSV